MKIWFWLKDHCGWMVWYGLGIGVGFVIGWSVFYA